MIKHETTRDKHRNTTTRKVARYAGVGALGLIGLGLGAGCDSQADPSYRGEALMSITGNVEAALSVGEVEVGILWLTTSEDFDLICTGEFETPSGEPTECTNACGTPTCANLESWDDCIESCPDTLVYVYEQIPNAKFITGGIGQTTAAQGQFPAQFSLDVLEPPPPEALIRDKTGQKLAIGVFVALDPSGAPWRFDLSQPGFPDWLLGGSDSHMLLFAPEALTPDAVWTTALGFPMGAGYQLMKLEPTPCEPDEDDCSDDGAEAHPVSAGEASSVSLRIAPPDTIAFPFLSQ
ncbi:MAG: hypothetical protein RL033_1786 [Pseudomonadota bacterium]